MIVFVDEYSANIILIKLSLYLLCLLYRIGAACSGNTA